MHIYFEDWSNPACFDKLDDKDLPHGGRIIKAFAAHEDPRQALGEEALRVVEVSGDVLAADEVYTFEGREDYKGSQLEDLMAGYNLSDLSSGIVRALFRFSNQNGFCQAAMAAKRKAGWLINHPLEDIDGLEVANRNASRARSMHLDLFFPETLDKLKTIVDYDDPGLLVGIRAGLRLRRAGA